MKAVLKNYRQSPRKVRLVANFAKGKNAKRVVEELGLLSKRAALPVKKVIESALANAKHNDSIDSDNLVVSEITVDKGIVLKRFMPKYGGRATRINKRTSRIVVTLNEEAKEVKKTPKKVEKKAKEAKKEVKKAPKKAVKKPVAKKTVKKAVKKTKK